MQSNRLILWSSLAALVLCAVPYGCAGKSVGSSSSDAQEGTSHHSVAADGRNPTTDGASFGDAAYQGDGGIRYADGAFHGTDGSSFIHGDGAPFPQGDGYCCADGWINSADGDQGDGRDRAEGDPRIDFFDGWDEQSDGQAPADNPDGNADGNF